jgi:GNAT superfamily N-acetyltransferase
MKNTPIPNPDSVRLVPATAEHWDRLERLFGPRGACAGCWCMWWRVAPKAWRAGKAGPNRTAFRALVRDAAVPPGIVALVGDEAIGWCAVAPRQEYPRLERSRILAPIDAASVWSVTCFFVARECRGGHLTPRLLEAAAELARRNGGRILEGYPVDTGGRRTAGAFLFTGTCSAFLAAGFREVARRSPTRPIMRRALDRGE